MDVLLRLDIVNPEALLGSVTVYRKVPWMADLRIPSRGEVVQLDDTPEVLRVRRVTLNPVEEPFVLVDLKPIWSSHPLDLAASSFAEWSTAEEEPA